MIQNVLIFENKSLQKVLLPNSISQYQKRYHSPKDYKCTNLIWIFLTKHNSKSCVRINIDQIAQNNSEMFLLVILAGKIEKLICNVTFEKIIWVNNEK